MYGNLESLRYIPSEGFLSAFLLAMLVLSFFLPKGSNSPRVFYPIGMLGLLATFAIEAASFGNVMGAGNAGIFHGLLRVDPLGYIFKLIAILTGLAFLFYSLVSRETSRRFSDAMEYTFLALSSTLGMMLLVGSSNVLMLYLAFELLSFTSYLLTGIVDRDEKTTEAAVKYLLYGGTASAVMVYWLSIVYGMTGTLDIMEMGSVLAAQQDAGPMLYLAMVLVLTGLGFKIAAVPFHLWCPDVYEGAATPFTAFLSVGSKAAGMAILVRVLYQVFAYYPGGDVVLPSGGVDWTTVIAAVSAISMTVGNLAALPQRNLKRMLAYSSIAHAGYALMALASRSVFGLGALYFYVAVYVIANLGAFLVIILVSNEYYSERLEAYEGLGWKGGKGAFLAAVMTVFLFSLTGIPPFAGFIGKVYLLMAVFKQGSLLYWLAVVAVINTIISLIFYARVVRYMFLSPRVRGGAIEKTAGGVRYAAYSLLGVLAVLSVVLGIYWVPLDRLGRLAYGFLN